MPGKISAWRKGSRRLRAAGIAHRPQMAGQVPAVDGRNIERLKRTQVLVSYQLKKCPLCLGSDWIVDNVASRRSTISVTPSQPKRARPRRTRR